MRKLLIVMTAIFITLVVSNVCTAGPELLRFSTISNTGGLYRFLSDPVFPGDVTITGDATISGTLTNALRPVEIEASSSETVLNTESGKVFVTTSSVGTVTYTLPTASTGLTFTFIDSSATAGDDLWITASTGDTINNGTAGKSYVSTADAIPSTVTLVAVNAGSWQVTSEVGSSWANDNN